ncbi:hypothetical protein NC652_015193 [Populus alba x Populus x berolinensis]|nr:hypothetical protein NC652_015193 [Populus alba x Populus x berolinensis]
MAVDSMAPSLKPKTFPSHPLNKSHIYPRFDALSDNHFQIPISLSLISPTISHNSSISLVAITKSMLKN